MATDLKLKNEDCTYNQQITVTGYSLGGHLATAFHILHQNDNLIKNTFTFNGAGVGSVGGDKITTGKELQDLITRFSDYRHNGANDKFTGALNNGITLNAVYQKIRNDLDTAYQKNAKKEDISEYYQSVNKSYKELQSIIAGMNYDINAQKGLNNIETAIERILQIAQEYQRIGEIKFPANNGETAKEPYNAQIGYIEALEFDYQLAVVLTTKDYVTDTRKAGTVVSMIENEIKPVDTENPNFNNLYNIKAENAPSMTAVSQYHYCSAIDIKIEDQPILCGTKTIGRVIKDLGVNLYEDIEYNDFGDIHSLVLMVDSLSVQSLFEQLDS